MMTIRCYVTSNLFAPSDSTLAIKIACRMNNSKVIKSYYFFPERKDNNVWSLSNLFAYKF